MWVGRFTVGGVPGTQRGPTKGQALLVDPWLKDEAWADFQASQRALRTLLLQPHWVVTSENSPETQGLSALPPTSGRSLAFQSLSFLICNTASASKVC